MALLRDETDFAATLGAAGAQLGMPAALVEKDYWIIQVLRGMSYRIADRYVFKGGTSLSKGFGILKRFSEDVDLLLMSNGDDAEKEDLLEAAARAGAEFALAKVTPSKTQPGVRRALRLDYPRRLGNGTIEYPYIRLELGFAGGLRPHVHKSLTTYVGDALVAIGQDVSSFEDLTPVATPILHPGRTLIEKLSLLHCRVSQVERSGEVKDPRLWVRHYYDVHCLLEDESARALCASREEFLAIVQESEAISRDQFSEWETTTRPDAGFGASPAFAETVPHGEEIGARYARAMKELYLGADAFPTWEEVRVTVRANAALL